MTAFYPATPIAVCYQRYRSFRLLVDSRRLADPATTLFFALPGARADGHDFIEDLYRHGVRHFVVHPDRARTRVRREVLRSEDVHLIVAPDPLVFLQDLAAHHRRRFDLPVVGITGSNGKTIVKDWLVALLQDRHTVCASPRSFNSQIGVPLSVWQLSSAHTVAVFEAGVSRSGEMDRLARIIRPTCGAFTLLGTAHAAGFHSPGHKLRQKLRLFAGADWVVVPADDNATKSALRKMDVEVIPQLGHGRCLVEVAEVPLAFDFPDWPRLYLDNAATALAVAYALGLTRAELTAALPRLQPLSNRLEQRAGLHGGPVINDTYSNDLSALAAALDFAVAQNPFDKLTLILGTLPPGYDPGKLHRLLSGRVTRLITVGPNKPLERRSETLYSQIAPPAAAALPGSGDGGAARFPTESAHYSTPTALLRDLPDLLFARESILVKGAGTEALGRVADALSKQRHRTVLRIDLAAVRHNFLHYRAVAGTRLIVMVKASAYGGGALPVARTLADAGADYLAVAYPDEGAKLRAGGIRLPVMVLNAAPHAFARMRDDGLEPVVHSLSGLRKAAAAGLRVHLELDTGMGRLGFARSSTGELLTELRQPAYASAIASIFTHLAASGDPAHDEFTRKQLTELKAVADRVDDVLPTPPARHALNTNGITRFPDYRLDFVRLGIGLYGIGDRNLPNLKPALHLSCRVTAVNERPAGATVGYGLRGRLSRKSRVAVLAIGYADGLPRAAGEGRFAVLIDGRPAPIIGSVCMDMTMVDVTDLPGATAGDEAVIFGSEHPIELLSGAAETIPYEVLTGIGQRVHRVYSQE